jgi:hypothetical protein
MKQIKYIVILMGLIAASCNSSSIDGAAQEEHRDRTDSVHTSFPAHNKSADAEDSTMMQSSDSNNNNANNR